MYMYIHVPALELIITSPYFLSAFIVAHVILILSFVGFIYWKKRREKELKVRSSVLIVSIVFALALLYLCLGLVNQFYDGIILTNKTIIVRTFCFVPLSVTVNINNIDKVLIVPWNSTKYELISREFGIGTYNYLAGYFKSREFGKVFVLLVKPHSGCYIIIVLKKCEKVCALYLLPPKNEYLEFINALKMLKLKIINKCK